MKRVCAVLLTLLLAISLALALPGAAEAKKKKHRDTPGCVTKAEYRSTRGGMTGAQVAQIYDTWGSSRYYNDHGYYEGAYVEDGYWDQEWIDTSYFDDQGNYVEDGYYEPTWVDTSYWDDSVNWVPVVDTVRTYKKCRSFNHGRGRVAINFDNYSRPWLSGPRVAYLNPSDPSFMDVAAYFRKGATGRLAPGKTVPHPRTQAQTPRPKSVPTSPRPPAKLASQHQG
jgi:hypothetical protein